MKNQTLIIALIMLCFAAVISCKKNQNNQRSPQESENATMKKISALVGLPQFPRNENGMLVFDNEEHFADYIEFLETAIDPQSYDSAYTNKDGRI